MTKPPSADAAPAQPEPERYLTAAEVAELMGFTAHTIRVKARNHEIPGHKINRAWRFLWSEIEAQRAAQSRARRATEERKRRERCDYS